LTRRLTRNTLAARGLEEPWVSLVFAIIVSFLLSSRLCTLFQRILIHDSRGFMILKKIWPNLLGLCHFPLNTNLQVCTDRRMDGRINPGWAG
jgi:hypothetical protein